MTTKIYIIRTSPYNEDYICDKYATNEEEIIEIIKEYIKECYLSPSVKIKNINKINKKGIQEIDVDFATDYDDDISKTFYVKELVKVNLAESGN